MSLNFFQTLILLVKELNFKILNIYKVFSYQSFFAINFYKLVYPEIKKLNLKKIILPYEGQPIQNFFIQKIKKKFKKTKIYGFLHTFPQAIPLNYIYRSEFSPNKLIINGISQKKCFIKYLRWKKNDLIIKRSLRFYENQNTNLENKILIPYKIQEQKKILNLIESFFSKLEDNSFPNLRIKNHPQKKESLTHIRLEKNLLKILKKYKKKFGSKKINNCSIFIESTSSVIEALERKINVFHLCTNPILQVYSPTIWLGLKRREVSKNLFNYGFNSKNALMRLGKKKIINRI